MTWAATDLCKRRLDMGSYVGTGRGEHVKRAQSTHIYDGRWWSLEVRVQPRQGE